MHRPRWPYCSRPWCPGNRAYNGAYYVKATEPLREDASIKLYGVTSLTQLFSSLWPLVASESLHGWPAERVPLSSVLLASSVMGLEPYRGSIDGGQDGLELELVENRVIVVGLGPGTYEAVRFLQGNGVKTLVFSMPGVDGLNRFIGEPLAGEDTSQGILGGLYIGRYDEGHAILTDTTLYLAKGPVIYAAGGEPPPPIAVNNDLPGIVSAGYGAELVELGYRPRRVVVLGYGYLASRVADWMASRGIDTTLVAARGALPEKPEKADLAEAGRVEGFAGAERVEAVVLDDGERLEADMVVSALGVYPDALPVYAAGYKAVYSSECYRFVPEMPSPMLELEERGMLVAAGLAAGYEWPEAVTATARYAAALVAYSLGKMGEGDLEHYYSEAKRALETGKRYCPSLDRPPVWLSGRIEGLQFIDLDEDLVLWHIYSAWRKGYRKMEMLKRVTGLGTGADQGRFSATSAAIILSAISGVDAEEIGVFRPRPPYFVPDASLLAEAPIEW